MLLCYDGLSSVYDEHVASAIDSLLMLNGLIDVQTLWEGSWKPFAEFLSNTFGLSNEGVSDFARRRIYQLKTLADTPNLWLMVLPFFLTGVKKIKRLSPQSLV